jgi:hypothetical protein
MFRKDTLKLWQINKFCTTLITIKSIIDKTLQWVKLQQHKHNKLTKTINILRLNKTNNIQVINNITILKLIMITKHKNKRTYNQIVRKYEYE